MARHALTLCDPCVFRHGWGAPRLDPDRCPLASDRPEPDVSRLAATPNALPQPARSAAWALGALGMAMLISSLGTSVANVALPSLAQEMGASFQAVQWVILSYLLAVTTLVVSVGRLGDLFGRRKLMLGGIAVFTVASVAAALSTDLWLLVCARAAQGFGAAVMMALSMALVADTASPDRSGRAMGLLGTVSAAGTALGPSLGGALIELVGWPAIFWLNAPLGLAAFAMAYRHLPRHVAAAQRPAFDFAGSALLAISLVSYGLAMTVGTAAGAFISACLLVVATSAAGLFVLVQLTARSPLVRPALFQNPVIRTGFVTSVLANTVAMTTLVVGPFYLAGALYLAPTGVGLAMTAGPLTAAFVGVLAGRGVDHFGAGRMTLVGIGAMASGCATLAALPSSLGVVGYVFPLVITTAGFATFQAANNTAVMASTDATQRGVVSGLLNLSRNLGLITGASAMGAVFAFATGTSNAATASAGAIATGMHTAFGVAAGLMCCAFAVALAAGAPLNRRKK